MSNDDYDDENDNYNKNSNDKWTEKREYKLMSWKDICKQYLEYHQKEKDRNYKIMQQMLVFNLILSGIAVVLNGIVFVNDELFLVGNICAAIINSILGGFQVYQRFEGNETKYSLHETAIKSFKRLHHTIETQLALPIYQRQNCLEFTKKIVKLFLEYDDDFEQPLLSLHTFTSKERINYPSITDLPSTPSPTRSASDRFDALELQLDERHSGSNDGSGGGSGSGSYNGSYNDNIEDEDDMEDNNRMGLTEDENTRFGFFIQRVSDKQDAMRTYQIQRLARNGR